MSRLPAAIPRGLPPALLRAVRDAPSAPLYKQIAAHWLALGDPRPAVAWMQAAAGLQPYDGGLQREFGCLLAHVGAHAAAADTLQTACRLQPGQAENWFFLGRTLVALQRGTAAAIAFRRAYELQPDQPRYLHACADAEFHYGFPDDALPLWRALHKSSKNDPAVTLRLGECLTRLNRVTEATQLFEHALATDPHNQELRLALAQSLEAEGRRLESQSALQQILGARPDWIFPLATLVGLQRGKAEPALLERCRAQIASHATPIEDQAQLGYELGKALDARGDHAGAFAAWTAANGARQRSAGIADVAEMKRVCALEVAAWSQFRDLTPADDHGADLLFIVGMPRSGTTLTEQILAAHPQAHGCGELPDIALLSRRLGPDNCASEWPPKFPIAATNLHWLGQRYRRRLREEAATAARCWIDKSPLNFHFLGLIAATFPAAKVIWCRRDPRDIAISIFGENFAPGERWATSLQTIGAAIQQHEWMMRQWQRLLPNPILEWQYESLVESPETQVATLLEFVGLAWSDRCLRFHELSTHVLTPSRWQVRQALHRGSSGRWRQYSQCFEGLPEFVQPVEDPRTSRQAPAP